MWKGDGSRPVSVGASDKEFIVAGEDTGCPVNVRFDEPLSSGQYFEVNILACGSGPFIGVTSEAGFGEGWECRGLLFGGPGNLSTGNALASEQFGLPVEEGMTVGV